MIKRYSHLLSVEQRVAMMTEEQIDEVLKELEVELLAWSWDWTARPDQLGVTYDEAHTVGFIAGRGGGKTRTGGEWVRKRVGRGKPRRFAFVGRTAADVRDTMMQGESGLLNCFPPSERPIYTPSNRSVVFHDGSFGLCYSAEEPGQLRGPQFHFAWADELAAWKMIPDDSGLNAWDNLNFATRLGDSQSKPQILFTTTPKRIKFIRDLLAKAKHSPKISIYNQASTYDNIHLIEEFLDVVESTYGGTRLAGQEIYGQLSGDVEEALWSEQLIEDHRVYTGIDPTSLPLKIVGVDPTTSDNPGDECGIVVIGATPKVGPSIKRTAYVLEDATIWGPPKVWAKQVAKKAKEHQATVIAEDNQGGAMVRDEIHMIDPAVPVRLVKSMVGKKLRAEPVSVATDRGQLKFYGRFPELEDQMTTWVPHETKGESPDRIDALVHACTGVITAPPKTKSSGGVTRVANPARGRSLGVVRKTA